MILIVIEKVDIGVNHVRERRESLSWIMLVILFLACTTIQGGGIVKAPPGTTVYVDPPISTANVNDTFSVDINVTDIEYSPPLDMGLYWWEFTLAFDPSLLQVVSYREQKIDSYTDTWAGDGATKSFVTTEKPLVPDSETVYLNGTLMTKPVNYTIDYEAGNITFTAAPGIDAEIEASYHFYETQACMDTWTGDGATTTFFTTDKPVVSYPPEAVFVNGVPQNKTAGDYTIDYEAGNITFATAPGSGATIMAVYRILLYITVDKVFEGPFLKDTGHPTTFSSNINNTVGTVKALAMFMPPYPPNGAVGGGVLCNITFHVKAEGETPIHFERTVLQTLVGDPPYLYPIPHVAVDGYFSNVDINHEIAVTNVTAFPTSVLVGESVSINATVKNEGDVAETFNVKAYHNYTEPEWSEISPNGTVTVNDLAPGNSETVSFTWISSTIHKGNFFIIKVEVPPIPGETDKTDNTKEFDTRVLVGEAPEASFTISPAPPYYVNLTLTFNASASEDPDGTIVSYAWDFGDDNNATEIDPVITHKYTAPGTYTVNLTVTDNHNFTGTTAKNVTAEIHDVAVVSVTALPSAVTVGANVSISVTVVNEGDFLETFSVTVYANETAIATKPVALSRGNSTALTFEWNTTDFPLGTYVIFANASVVEGETDITDNKYIDGTVTVGEVKITDHHVVVGGFTFHVITEGNSTVSDFEFIQADKKISFIVAGANGAVGFCNVTIPKDLLEAPLDQWNVQVDDTPLTSPELLSTENVTHTFIYFTFTPGTHMVEIVGATAATPPVATFTYSPADPVVDETVALNASSSYDPDGTIVSYAWDFGDDTNGTGMTTTHAYDSSGTYTVTLTVTDDSTVGLTNTTVLTVTVHLAGPSPTPFPWTVAIAILVVAAIAIAGVAVYVLKIRKPQVASASEGAATSSVQTLRP